MSDPPTPPRHRGIAAGTAGLAVVLLYLSLCGFFVYVTTSRAPRTEDSKIETPLERILASGTLTAIIPNNAHCYHLYREEAVGLEYELVRAFSQFLGVDLKVSAADSWDEMFRLLENGEGDLVAAGMPPAGGSPVPAMFSRGHLVTRQQLVLRRGSRKIDQPGDMARKTIHVPRGSVYEQTLEGLRRDGIDINIVALENVPTEELIRMVADGEVAATVAHDHIIRVNRRYYPRALAAGPVADPERLAWAVPPHAADLLDKIDRFFEKIAASGVLEKIYQRHYGAADRFEYVDARYFERRVGTLLPKYRVLIEAAAKTYGFDWRLIAAQIYQESHFDPEARSPAEAAGLMQLTPATAAGLGVLDPLDPAENIQAGVAHLKYLYEHFNQPVEPDRIKIALAAYNIGVGHILDARALARQKNQDPNRWDALAENLPLLAYPRYYRNATYGYCRGTEPVRYVERILSYYEILKRREVGAEACDPRDLAAIKVPPPAVRASGKK